MEVHKKENNEKIESIKIHETKKDEALKKEKCKKVDKKCKEKRRYSDSRRERHKGGCKNTKEKEVGTVEEKGTKEGVKNTKEKEVRTVEERGTKECVKNTKEKEIGTTQEIHKTSKDEKKKESSRAKNAVKEHKKVSFGDIVPYEFV